MATGAAVVVGRLRMTPPAPAVVLSVLPAVAIPGPVGPPVVQPASGSMVIEAEGVRLVGAGPARVAAVDPDTPRPIASVAKTLTALTVLSLLPLRDQHDEGPHYRITATDVRLYHDALGNDESVVPVVQGEEFTERQLLLALMLPSGNNIARTLATWAAGTPDLFLQKADALARSLGTTHTHMTDPSGLDSATVASAADLVLLGRAALRNVALAAVVGTRTATLPDGTTTTNLDTGLDDVPGWLGIKTGNSNAAGGCLLFAASRPPAGDVDPADAVTVVGAILDQRATTADPTGNSDRQAAIVGAEQAVTSALAGYVTVRASAFTPELTGTVAAAWGPSTPVTLGGPHQSQAFVARVGATLTVSATASPPAAAPLEVGSVVGRVDAGSNGTLVATWSVVTLNRIPAPDWTWRLQHA